jgi:hypothetical protein
LNSEHSPLPWHHNVTAQAPIYSEETGDFVAVALTIKGRPEVTMANLWFIVRACNSHYELADLLDRALRQLKEREMELVGTTTQDPLIADICAFFTKLDQ